MYILITWLLLTLPFYWLLRETDYLRVRLPTGIMAPALDLTSQIDRMYHDWIATTMLERISWSTCISRYGNHFLSTGVDEPLCGWDWLRKNTHPVPRVIVDFVTGGVRYHWDIKDCQILKKAITATHSKPKANGHLRLTRNKLGGLVAPLPSKR